VGGDNSAGSDYTTTTDGFGVAMPTLGRASEGEVGGEEEISDGGVKAGEKGASFPRANASHEWVSRSFPPAKLHICISVGQEGEFRDPLSFLLHVTPICGV
jgi:hypothetical protein